MKNSTKIILWLIVFFPYGLYLLIRQVLFKVQKQFDAQEEETKARLAEQEKKKKENIKWQKKYGQTCLFNYIEKHSY